MSEQPQTTETPAVSDDQLKQLGLEPIKAWRKGDKTGNARRIEKHREKKQAEGIKQLNVQVPVDARDSFKALAERVRDLGSLDAAIQELAQGSPFQAARGSATVKDIPRRDPDQFEAIKRTLERGGLRAKLIRWLSKP